jgi:hypothetical protein
LSSIKAQKQIDVTTISPSICSRLTATSFVKFLLLSRVNEGASASCSVYHSAASFVSNICSPLTATSFVKFLMLSRANEGASVSCSLDHSATSFVLNGFLRTLQVTLKSISLYFIWLWILLSAILLVSRKLFRANYFSLHLHFTRECEINPVSEFFNFCSHKDYEFYEIPVKVFFSGFCLDSSLLLELLF